MRYKIDFGLAFAICIIIMILGQVWTYFGELPEAFTYGSIVYKVVATLFFILTNLSIGTAAAIVFYFMQQFSEKKKTFEIYTDLRADSNKLLYDNMMILRDIHGFEELTGEQRHADFFYTLDAPLLFEVYNNIQEEEFKNNLKEYFLNAPKERLQKIMVSFEKTIQSLETKKDKRYFKDSKDLIESVTINFRDDGDFAIGFDWILNAKSDKEKENYVEGTVDDYLYVLHSSIELYEEVQEFINCIEKKKIIKFMRMLD